MNEKSRSRWTIIGCIIIILVYACEYHIWLLITTYTSSTPSIVEQKTMRTNNGIADFARTNTALVYRNNVIYRECDQGCEAINLFWKGMKYRTDGKIGVQPCLQMYFSSYQLETDSIIPANSLVIYLNNGDSIAKHAVLKYMPHSTGHLKRYYFCHASRESSYEFLTNREITLLRSCPIVSMKIETQNDVLIKSVSPKASQNITNRLSFLLNSL